MRGGAWVMFGYMASNLIRLFSNLAVAYFLSPVAFGIFAVGMSIQTSLEMITDLGVNASVVREKEGESPTFIRTAWTVQLIRNLLIGCLLLMVAGLALTPLWAAWFADGTVYREPVMPAIIAAIAITVIFNGFRSLGTAVHERRLNFHRVMTLQIASQLSGSVATVSAAMLGCGVWSLVIGMVTNTTISVVGSYLYMRMPRPHLALDRAYLGIIVNYGKWLLVASLLGFITNRGDQLIFGGLLDASQFGLYAVAGIWVFALRSVFSMVSNKLAYPVFSEIARERPDDRTRIYYRLRLMIDLAAVGIFVAIALLAEPVFNILYADRYDGVGAIVKLMSLMVLLLPFNLLSTILLSKGESRRFAVVVIGPALAIVLGVPLVFDWYGFRPAVIVAASANLMSIPVLWAVARDTIRLDFRRELPLLACWLAALVYSLM